MSAADVREALIDAMINVQVSGGMVEFGADDRGEAAYIADAILAEPRLRVALSTPPADDVREAEMRELHHFEVEQQLAETIAIVKRAQAAVLRHEHTPASLHMDSILNEINLNIPSGSEVRPHGTVTDAAAEPVETYAVYGGQGLRRIASGLSREDAERVSRKFEIDCMNAGLTNPPGRIEREARP